MSKHSEKDVKKILVISGEASGDLHGSNIIKALQDISPHIETLGLGGPRMIREGLKGRDSTEIAVVGIFEVLKKLPKINDAFNYLKDLVRKENFDCALLIDYPDFNLRFASFLKDEKVPVVYYVSPQVWAWRRNRVYKIAKLVDKMLVVFPFEVSLYEDTKLDTVFVGHPLGVSVRCEKSLEQVQIELSIDANKKIIAFVPGSRREEVKKLLPYMIKAGENFLKEDENLEFVLPLSNTIDEELIKEELENAPYKIKIIRDRFYETLSCSYMALVASGTASLETALMEVPMVIIYKVSYLTGLIGKMMIKIKDLGLPNIVAEKRIVPELYQDNLTVESLTEEGFKILKDEETYSKIKKDLKEVREKLKSFDDPYKKAAQEVINFINK